jgi:hypothetical protein
MKNSEEETLSAFCAKSVKWKRTWKVCFRALSYFAYKFSERIAIKFSLFMYQTLSIK